MVGQGGPRPPQETVWSRAVPGSTGAGGKRPANRASVAARAVIEVIEEENLRENTYVVGGYLRKRLEELLGADMVGDVVLPTMSVEKHTEIDLGNRTIAFTAHGIAHTDCDLSMLDRTTGLLLPADLLFVRRVPSLDGSLLGWLRELDALRAMGAQRAVPGHGPLVVDYAPAAAALARYLTALRDGTRGAITSGAGIEAAVSTVAQSERDRWALFDDYNGRNVTEAYKELEWE